MNPTPHPAAVSISLREVVTRALLENNHHDTVGFSYLQDISLLEQELLESVMARGPSGSHWHRQLGADHSLCETGGNVLEVRVACIPVRT
jgi:hypothetical protein